MNDKLHLPGGDLHYHDTEEYAAFSPERVILRTPTEGRRRRHTPTGWCKVKPRGVRPAIARVFEGGSPRSDSV